MLSSNVDKLQETLSDPEVRVFCPSASDRPKTE
jgi:hypothetical protein